MVQDKNLEAMISILKQAKIPFAYLFGSRAEGTAYETSDYDLAIYAEEMSLDQLTELREDLSVLVYPLEVDLILLNKASIMLRFEIISRGKTLYYEDEEQMTDFEEIIIRDYLDFEPFYRKFIEELLEVEGEAYGE